MECCVRARGGKIDIEESARLLFCEKRMSELLVTTQSLPAWWRRDGRRRICDLPRHPAGQTKGHSYAKYTAPKVAAGGLGRGGVFERLDGRTWATTHRSPPLTGSLRGTAPSTSRRARPTARPRAHI